jgi:hypothetical protein
MLKTSRSMQPAAALTLLTVALLAAAPVPVALAQNQLWITQFGLSANDEVYALVPGVAGTVVVAGNTWNSLGGPNAGRSDAFVSQYDDLGNRIWLRQFGSQENDLSSALAHDGAGGVMVAGITDGDMGSANAGNEDVFLARLDSAGNQLWIRQFGTDARDEATALAPDGTGGVVIAGYTGGSLGGPNPGRMQDAFVARYDGDGNRLWILQFGTSDRHDRATSLLSDGTGGVIIAGYTGGSLGGPNAGIFDAFVARFDRDGIQQWIHQFGTSLSDEARALSPDGAGGFMVAGYLGEDLDTETTNGFLARYDGAGNQLWIRQFGTNKRDEAWALAPDGNGGFIVGGVTLGSLGGPKSGQLDCFLVGFDGDGNAQWFRQFGSSEFEFLTSITAHPGGGVFVGGLTAGNIAGPSFGGNDAFLARYTIDSCYADCDQSSGAGVLDMQDFLCWQDDFVAGNSYACDCDTSTGMLVCDIFDFLCFQNAFVGGCP